MRKLALVIAAFGALTVAAPAVAADTSTGSIQAQQSRAAQSQQADEFSSHRRRHWHRHRHWHRPHYRPYRYGWHRCRTVWRPHRGYVRICRW
jgi:hypothetical protein